MRQIPHYCCFVLLTLPFSGTMATAADHRDRPRAVFKDGSTVPGRLFGKTAADIAFEPDDGSTPARAASLAHFVWEPRLRRFSTAGPARRVALCGGERLHAEAVLTHDGELKLWRSGVEQARIPPGLVSGLYAPAGEQPVAYEDFEGESSLFAIDKGPLPRDAAQHRSGARSLLLSPGTPPCTMTHPKPVTSGRIELSFFDEGRSEPALECQIELQFRSDETASTLRVIPGWTELLRCDVPANGEWLIRRLRRSSGWHDLTIDFDQHRVAVLVDDDLLARGPGVASPLASVRFAAPEGSGETSLKNGDALPRFWIDDVKIARDVEPFDEPGFPSTQGAVWLEMGDEVFGDPMQIDAHRVIQNGPFGRQVWQWETLRGVRFPLRKIPTAAPVSGLIAGIDLAPLLYSGLEESDRLVVAIQSIDDREVVAEHPWLGSLKLPLAEVFRISPLFVGSLQLVDPATHHLGDSIREDLNAKLPEGTRWERDLSLPAAPRDNAWLSLLVAELEPGAGRDRQVAGPGIPRTDVFVNGRRIDTLNRHVRLRAHPSNPERLRIEVPARSLRTGANTIRIEQRPAPDDPREFDDFEFSRVALEIE